MRIWRDPKSADAQWARIEPLLPDRTPKRGGRWRGHRQVIDAIALKCRTGTPRIACPTSAGRGRASISGCGSGRPTAPGRMCSRLCLRRPTPRATWTGSSRSTPRPCGLISTPPGPVKRGCGRRADRPCLRTLSRRADDRNPSRSRRPLPAAGMGHHACADW
ncbi:transposase [Streptomyces sp. NPDC055721]|uniref:transposase n=1 Tax=Streptomyces sp. NPDC127132 TaxID=3345374 RepID=UPI0036259308